MKRLFDVVAATAGLVVLSPLLAVIAAGVRLTSRGPVLFRQERVGRNGRHFTLYKFRTMRQDAESSGQITVGGRDPRITRIGYFLRKYKVDELPQLLNVLNGTMSVVGPRPEVPRYVALYSEEDRAVLSVRPGLTDYASLEYFNENELLGASPDPEATYRKEVMPAKLALNRRYIREAGMATDFRIILKTIGRVFGAASSKKI